ncbi:MAG TPA: Rossmann-like and DUF2520 domain-containing protein [Longimicrobiales bacterium]
MSDRIVIIGPGRMGLALGTALVACDGVGRLTYYGREVEPPPHPLFQKRAGGVEYRIGPQPLPEDTTIVVLAVPDDRLGEVAQGLAAAGAAPAGCVAFHLAGALTTEVLAPLHAVGYAVGSLHPLQSVADPWSGGDRLVGAAFALAGDAEALAAGRRLVDALRGRALVVPPALRPLYHAAAVFASNYVVALVAVAARLLREAGVAESDALPAVLPLVRGTLDNLEQLGISAALTGPIARGDVDTVRRHLARLSPGERPLYSALGLEALGLARAAGLDAGRAAELEALLSFE